MNKQNVYTSTKKSANLYSSKNKKKIEPSENVYNSKTQKQNMAKYNNYELLKTDIINKNKTDSKKLLLDYLEYSAKNINRTL
jgi:hypothetical protein